MNTEEVLVVGAGPAGLATATELALHGVRALVVERRAVRSTAPKATTISVRSMELLRRWGLAERVRAGGIDGVEWRLRLTPTLAAGAAQVIDLGLPSSAEAALVSPESPAAVSQEHLEATLEQHLGEAGVPLLRGTSVVEVDAGPDGVTALLRDDRGDVRAVAARYLVAADGVRGSLRELLGITAGPSQVTEEGVSVSFRAPLWELVGTPRHGLYVTTGPGADGLFLPETPPDGWRWAATWPAGTRPPADELTEAALTARIRAGIGVPDLPLQITGIHRTEYGARLAHRFRRGSAFLAGDAAHRVTPRGGTGLNMAVHDGLDLGWKLGWVLRGLAGEELLDSYEAERRPPAEHNTARSLDENGSRRPVAEELAVDLGGRLPHVPLPDGGSTLDLVGTGLTLLTDRPGRWPDRHPVAGPPVETRRVPPLVARRLGLPPGGALLVRPDGVPLALLPEQAGLDAALAPFLTAPATASTPA